MLVVCWFGGALCCGVACSCVLARAVCVGVCLHDVLLCCLVCGCSCAWPCVCLFVHGVASLCVCVFGLFVVLLV